MNRILVIGASGLVGKHLALALPAEDYTVRCMARTPSRVQDLATAGCEVVQRRYLRPRLHRPRHGIRSSRLRLHPHAVASSSQRGGPRLYGRRNGWTGEHPDSVPHAWHDLAAEVLGRKHPAKFHIPAALLGAFAPIIERMAKLRKSAMKNFLDSMDADCVGSPMPIRALLPRPPLNHRHAVETVLHPSK